MSMVVWKYDLGFVDWALGLQHVSMPRDAALLSVQLQGDWIVLYALHHSTTGDWVRRKIVVLETGKEQPNDTPLTFVGAVMFDGGKYVLHVFDGGET